MVKIEQISDCVTDRDTGYNCLGCLLFIFFLFQKIEMLTFNKAFPRLLIYSTVPSQVSLNFLSMDNVFCFLNT